MPGVPGSPSAADVAAAQWLQPSAEAGGRRMPRTTSRVQHRSAHDRPGVDPAGPACRSPRRTGPRPLGPRDSRAANVRAAARVASGARIVDGRSQPPLHGVDMEDAACRSPSRRRSATTSGYPDGRLTDSRGRGVPSISPDARGAIGWKWCVDPRRVGVVGSPAGGHLGSPLPAHWHRRGATGGSAGSRVRPTRSRHPVLPGDRSP